MESLRYALMLMLVALALPAGPALAALSDYTFTVGTGTQITPPSYSAVWTGYQRGRGAIAGQSATLPLPFTFYFNNNPYSSIRISSHGLITFGSSVNTSYNNSMPSAASFGPTITAFWDNNYVSGPATSNGNNCGMTSRIRYGTSGSTGNRIFVIDYDDISHGYCNGCQYGPSFLDWQVRLYEGTNKVEFYYSNMSNSIPSCMRNWGTRSLTTSGSIGLAATTSDYMSVTPNGSSATMSRSSFNNNINLGNSGGVPINSNVTYTFTPCNLDYLPNVADGGVTGMATGSILMSNITVQRGESQMFNPFTLSLPSAGCGVRSLTVTLSGPHAADYAVTPLGSTSINPLGLLPFFVTFTPQSIGQRTATLTVVDQFGAMRSFTLRATGSPRVSWTPDLAQGGTASLLSGDTVLKDLVVQRRTSRDFSPFTLLNFSTNNAIPPADVTYTIDSAGFASTQYQLVSSSPVSLAAGISNTPVIRFSGTGLGPQDGRLTVNADGEIRVFPLRSISGAPMVSLTSDAQPVDLLNPLFHQSFSCVGEQSASIPLTISNPGWFPLIVSSVEFYQTDTMDHQGTPKFPLSRDAQGRMIPMRDYVLTTSQGSGSMSMNTPVSMPITVAPGSSMIVYATFVGTAPGKRFGRAYMRTNAENVAELDTNLVPESPVLGLQSFHVLANATGSALAADAEGLKLKTIVFPNTRVGDTANASFTIANNGTCDLRINKNKLRIYSGDVREFKMMTSLRNAWFDGATNDYVIGPGLVDTIDVRFTPSRAGTRMATLWIQTNDSSIARPNLSERGSVYLDLTGRGLAGLDSKDLVLDPVVIGTFVNGVAVFENSQTTAVGVASVGFAGGDAAEFGENPATPWPARPFNVLPGEKLNLALRLTPLGAAGIRRTTLEVVTTTGDTIRVQIHGEAGTQTLVVAPNSLFDNVIIGVGQTNRQTLMISNNGTLPVRITDLKLTGIDSLSYLLGTLPRRDLEAGQTEYLEVTFAPSALGTTAAQLEVTASNGQTYNVLLGGTALRVRRDPADPSTATTGAAGDLRTHRKGDQPVSGRPRPTLR